MRYFVILVACMAACDIDAPRTQPPADSVAPDSLAADPAAAPATPATATVADRSITPEGIGLARAGMTIGELRAALEPGTTLGRPIPYMVDIDAMSVVQDADTLYHVLIVAGESSADDAPIGLLATENETFHTAAGIGAGATLADVAAAYGGPTLSYNINDESREYASAPSLDDRIRLRVTPASDTSAFAGVYHTSGEYNQTTEYDPAARVMMVFVRLH